MNCQHEVKQYAIIYCDFPEISLISEHSIFALKCYQSTIHIRCERIHFILFRVDDGFSAKLKATFNWLFENFEPWLPKTIILKMAVGTFFENPEFGIKFRWNILWDGMWKFTVTGKYDIFYLINISGGKLVVDNKIHTCFLIARGIECHL